ncbi:MAG TPA: response regulator [Cyanobacteria bacterium UBA11149]|nr:response regulator [Cyanobacteria bacterium UBA11367]HBE60728.1 response regulator [Cyanobacteria bacterium UBA11366]HBK65459.1 response regulator [Cyanobacteria bacterium UBA11166]HBR74475.1 response regulator [Cyanobacteria bacterium UBA11159]HBS68273.1 response regulator [Cyanobacteria bacterium UBA11153]HBW91386.1 response regulator [Cyanobacteria bacterium UBA11149]HCA93579.1 response regulator [Cyanobacteria bacterium UBA9226]
MLTPSSVSSMELPIGRQELVFSTEDLIKQIQDCATKQFTGKLDLHITGAKPQLSSLYFSLGGLVGCTNDWHTNRRWFRQLSLHCPQLIVNSTAPESQRTECWDYNSLSILTKQGKIPLMEMAELIEGHAIEMIFDIIQAGEKIGYIKGLQLLYRPIPENAIDLGLVAIRADKAWRQAIQAWQDWQEANLEDISPNLAPKIVEPEQLRQQTSSHAYRNLTNLADGNYTLRDLAVKLTQTALPLTQSILPYIRNRLMKLVEVEDLILDIKSSQKDKRIESQIGKIPTTGNKPPQPSTSNPKAPLIAYIDDSRTDSQTMGNILTQAGYRFINIQDSVQALIQLLEHKPDLIFLDLVMPIANGYEICAQIRRVSTFKDTPVIILTGNDGFVDRVRAKMVGSSGFLSKPITSEKILGVLQRYHINEVRGNR